jgi:hypothetical protein
VTRDLVTRFIGAFLFQEAVRSPAWPAPEDAWKASYVIGLVLGEALQGRLGMATRLTPQEVRDLAAGAGFQPDADPGRIAWDAEAFAAGLEALREVHITKDGLEVFRASGAMAVAPDEVRRLYRALGALADDFPLAAPPA